MASCSCAAVAPSLYALRRGVGKQLPIHSLKWNPNDVLTTCKVIMGASVSGFLYCARAEFVIPSVNRTRNMAADVSAKCGGFFLVYSTIFFISKPFNLENLLLRGRHFKHSSFSQIKVSKHFVNVYFFALKKPLELLSLLVWW